MILSKDETVAIIKREYNNFNPAQRVEILKQLVAHLPTPKNIATLNQAIEIAKDFKPYFHIEFV